MYEFGLLTDGKRGFSNEMFLTGEDQSGLLVSDIIRYEQKLSSPAGIFEILASHHAREENVEETPSWMWSPAWEVLRESCLPHLRQEPQLQPDRAGSGTG